MASFVKKCNGEKKDLKPLKESRRKRVLRYHSEVFPLMVNVVNIFQTTLRQTQNLRFTFQRLLKTVIPRGVAMGGVRGGAAPPQCRACRHNKSTLRTKEMSSQDCNFVRLHEI